MDLRENSTRQTVLSNDLGPDDLVVTESGQDLIEDNPPNSSQRDETEANNDVEVVGEAFIDFVSCSRRNDRSDDQEEVGEEEEDLRRRSDDASVLALPATKSERKETHDDRERSRNRGRPLVFGLVEVDHDEGEGDEGVEDVERIGDEVEEEGVSVSTWGSEDAVERQQSRREVSKCV